MKEVVSEEDASKMTEQRKSQNLLSFEVFDQAYIEVLQQDEYTQIEYFLPSSIHMMNLITEPTRNREYYMEMQEILYPLIFNYLADDTDIEVMEHLQKNKICKDYIHSVIDIVPYSGFLPPHECQLISVRFNPQPDTVLKAKAVCYVHGGVEKAIYITGMATNMSYNLNCDFIEFGRQVS